MPAVLPTTAARCESVLRELAKLEVEFSERAAKDAQVSDQERQKGNHGNRAYWSGHAEGQRYAARLAGELYERCRLILHAR